MRVLLLCTAFSGMAQRVLTELYELNHSDEQHYDLDAQHLRVQVQRFRPDVIVCPFLTQRIPADIWQNYLCLIVHPGIEGDQGPSSLDWAIQAGLSHWGVTLLQATDEFDGGPVWGTVRFVLRPASKTSIYKREVTQAAVQLIKQALTDIALNQGQPRPRQPIPAAERGCARPLMRQGDRSIDWHTQDTQTIVRRLQAADSRPGVKSQLWGHDVYLYGAVAAVGQYKTPGQLIAQHQGKLCYTTLDGCIWVRQIKCMDHAAVPAIKVPASWMVNQLGNPNQPG